ncbi:MAG: replication initiator protein [Microviridae sp.]|nr:MAG: replication initiator protein [Microviridae sp.]
MPCFSPLPYKIGNSLTKAGKSSILVLPRTEANLALYPLRVPCGNCQFCRLKRSRHWAIRCMHEASLYLPSFDNPLARSNCFITLTYNNAHLPEHNTLVKDDFKNFMKRLRKRFVPKCPYPKGHSDRSSWFRQNGIRYYMCGEYGSKYSRPHYHALLFNFNFDFDKYFWQKSPSGSDLYRSPSLEAAWSDKNGSIGYSSVADLTFDSAAYVARYVMKKINGDAALTRYAVIDEDSGEVLFDKVPEYNAMSRKPGIARDWISKHYKDVYSNDSVVVKNTEYSPPKFYDNYYELVSPEDLYNIKQARLNKAKSLVLPESRLAVLSKCKSRQVERLYRNLDDYFDNYFDIGIDP